MEFRRVFCVLACALTLVAWTAPASAAQWLFVGTFGTDSSGCGPSGSPTCRTLQQAATNASAGDFILLESADSGPATITKSLNIVGTIAQGIYSPGAPCLTVSAGAADIITMTQVVCDMSGAAKHGIVFNSGKRLVLDSVEIRNGGGATCGILFFPHTNSELSINNSTISNFGMSGNGGGICLTPRTGHNVKATANYVNFLSDRFGVRADATGGPVSLLIANSNIQSGNIGISSAQHSSVFVKNSTVMGNTTGLTHPTAGTLVSLGGNLVTGNTTKGTFTSTSAPK
jgi:hypothetical protein